MLQNPDSRDLTTLTNLDNFRLPFLDDVMGSFWVDTSHILASPWTQQISWDSEVSSSRSRESVLAQP